MFSSGTNTGLRRGCPRQSRNGRITRKDVFELYHPGIGEEQRRIIGNQGGTRYELMIFALKKV